MCLCVCMVQEKQTKTCTQNPTWSVNQMLYDTCVCVFVKKKQVQGKNIQQPAQKISKHTHMRARAHTHTLAHTPWKKSQTFPSNPKFNTHHNTHTHRHKQTCTFNPLCM
eukprot:GDKI01018089.1.p2 GENE.GDKI01018089.1~~GDKI01018089.1.p2  ORF type:complete len:109 (-),score=41.90 GDKI01018089.1:58-384(-)